MDSTDDVAYLREESPVFGVKWPFYREISPGPI